MIHQRQCPFCRLNSDQACEHLALAVETRDFVRRCIELSNGQSPWKLLCRQDAGQASSSGGAPGTPEDFTWLETAFCKEFLGHLSCYGGMDHVWRSGPGPGQGGFWVLLWSRKPKQLWWELKEELDRRSLKPPAVHDDSPWLIWMAPK
jgi:hypothetical protein